MQKKFELTDITQLIIGGTVLHRIRALKDFGCAQKGDLGGWVESEENLSQEGDCWIYNEAKVFGMARVSENADIRGNAKVSGNACVTNYAMVSGNATVTHDAIVEDWARIWDKALITGMSNVKDRAQVSDRAMIDDYASISGNASIEGDAFIGGCSIVKDTAQIYENAELSGNAFVGGSVKVCGRVRLGAGAVLRGYDRTDAICRSEEVMVLNMPSVFFGGSITYTPLDGLWQTTKFSGDKTQLIRVAYEKGYAIGDAVAKAVNGIEQLYEGIWNTGATRIA